MKDTKEDEENIELLWQGNLTPETTPAPTTKLRTGYLRFETQVRLSQLRILRKGAKLMKDVESETQKSSIRDFRIFARAGGASRFILVCNTMKIAEKGNQDVIAPLLNVFVFFDLAGM